MLKLIEISYSEKIYIESDYYIPVKIRFEHWENTNESRHCWGIMSNDEKSLFEIFIGEISGKLKYFTLVMCNNFHLNSLPRKSTPSISQKPGLPVFETQTWDHDDYYTRKIFDFDVYLNKPNISIILFSREIEKIVYNDRVFFGFDKDNILSSIEVKNLPTDEWNLLEESLKVKNKK
jgi:hypothetical protein